MKRENFFRLIVSIIICEFAGVAGSVFTTPKITGWYSNLQKPFLSPPNWVFGPVWTALFILMGISLWLLWESKKKKERDIAIKFFAAQLALNTLWSILFFGLESPFLAFVGVIILWLAILLTIIKSYKVNKTAAYLLIPYIAWVSFASYLNLFIWLINY